MYEMEGLTRSGCTTSPIARIRVRCLTTAGFVHTPRSPVTRPPEERPGTSPERSGISPGPVRHWRQTDFYRPATQRRKGRAASSGLIVRPPLLPTAGTVFSTGGTWISPREARVFHRTSRLLWTRNVCATESAQAVRCGDPGLHRTACAPRRGLRSRGDGRRGARRSCGGHHADVPARESPGRR